MDYFHSGFHMSEINESVFIPLIIFVLVEKGATIIYPNKS